MEQFDNAVKRYKKVILDELHEAGADCWLAGGALRDYFMGIPIRTDYDLFFPDYENYNAARIMFEMSGGEIKWESDNGMKIEYKGRVYDLVKKFFLSPEDTIEAFDFTIAMFAVDRERVYHGETSFIDLSKRQLMINKITYPASTLSRAFRFYKKGFSMCLVEMRKIIEAIQDMPRQQEIVAQEGVPSILRPSGDSFWTGID